MTRVPVVVFVASLLCAGGSSPGLPHGASGFADAPGPVWQPADTLERTTEPRPAPGLVSLDSALVFVPMNDGDVLTRRFEENAARPLSSYLSVSAREFYGIERYELSKFQCAVYGADEGVTLGLIVGALGMTAGLWDERTAWYMAGAAAALGALRGASMADEPGFRVRLRWDDDRGPSSP